MDTVDHIRLRRAEVASRWGDLTLGSYPEASARFFISEADPFRNPVGATVRRAVGKLLDGILGEAAEAEIVESLDAIIRLRAVQEFSAGQAVGFVLLLKRALREVLGDELWSPAASGGREIEDRIDALTLRAVDLLVACRQRVFELRAGEARARVHSLLRRAGMLSELEGDAAAEPVITKGGCAS